ncbi:MAG TPA: YbjN domain-containing protein [Solirubrobacteraceae bacterium]|jgi:hypothetical protein|nr:YbjN domain-containing protein [Solirubrobacteraceae bacterium]
MSAVYEALRVLFLATGMDVEEHPDQEWIGIDGFGEHGSWLLVGQACDERGAAVVYSVLPIEAPPERRDAVALLFARINYGLVLGNFDIDLDDGEIRFKCAAPVGDTPGSAELDPLVIVALSVTDHYIPAILAVIEGRDPATVAASVEQG